MARQIDLGQLNDFSKTKKVNKIPEKKLDFKKSSSRIERIPDFSNSRDKIKKEKKKKKGLSKMFLVIFIFLGLLGVFGGIIWFMFGDSILAASKAVNINLFDYAANKLTGNEPKLASTNGRTTFLILGVDNRSDDLTFDLKKISNTDTIMMVSLDNNTNKVNFLSIPRDIGVNFKLPNGKTQYAKINAAVNIGTYNNYPGGGIQLIMDTLKDMTGLEVNYSVIVDMDAFVKVIDSIGGVDINVENTFCDAGYPLAGDKGIQTVKFYKGEQHMDGATALKFARSRVHNECSNMTAGDPVFEGTDFRRSYRQQQVIKAVEDKANKNGLDLSAIQNIIQAVGNNVLTHMGAGPMSEATKIDLNSLQAAYSLKSKISLDTQYNFVATPTSCGGKALKEYNQPDGYYIIPYKAYDFTNLRSCVSFYLTNPTVLSENANIEVYNSGYGITKTQTINTTLSDTWLNSTYAGSYTFKKPTDTTQKDLTTGLYVVDYSGTKTNTVNFIAQQINATVIQKTDLPKGFAPDYGTDIVVIAGAAQ